MERALPSIRRSELTGGVSGKLFMRTPLNNWLRGKESRVGRIDSVTPVLLARRNAEFLAQAVFGEGFGVAVQRRRRGVPVEVEWRYIGLQTDGLEFAVGYPV